MATHNTKLGCTVFIDQPDSLSGFTWGTPKTFVTSGDGAAGGNTIVASTLAPTSDDMFVGNWVQCIYAANAANIGLRRRVTACDFASTTLTCDKFPAQVSSGDAFYLLVPQYVWMAEDTGATDSAVKDATRDEADDYWNGTVQEGGPRLEAIAADNIAKTSTYLVTDFENTLGVASATLGANTAVGDLFEIWQHMEPSEVSFDLTQENIDNPIQGVYETAAQLAGNRSGSGSLVLPFRGPGNGRTTGDTAECHRALKCVLDPTLGTNLTVQTGSNTSSIAYDAGTAVDGMLYLTQEGDAFMCSSAATPCVPAPTLTTAPVADTTIVGMTTYKPSLDLNYALAAKRYLGNGIIEYVMGCAPNFKVTGELGSPLKMEFPLQVSDWARISSDSAGAHTRAWSATRSTINPLTLQAIRLRVDNTAWACKSFNFDLGLDLQKSINLTSPNGTDGFRVTGYNPTGQIAAYVDSTNISAIDDFLAKVERGLMIQCGTRAGFPGVFALYIPKISYVNIPSPSDESGMLLLTIDFKVDYSAVTSTSTFAIGIC